MDHTDRDRAISNEFIAVYNQLDGWIRSILKEGNDRSFSAILKELATRYPAIDRNYKFSVTDENYDATLTVKKLIAYCNSVAGYDILLSASAMVSASVSHIITYSVTAGGATVTTAADGSETAATNKVTEKTSLDRIDFYGADITITVNETDYLSAVTSTYAGPIKITLIIN